MKIISWNVNGIRSAAKKGFFEWLEKEDPDIVCLQEIKIGEDKLTFEYLYPDNYEAYFNTAERPGYSGVAVFSKEKPVSLKKELGMQRFDSEGRMLQMEFHSFTLVNLYIPQGSRDKSNMGYKLKTYNNIHKYLGDRGTKNTIILGDFNVAHNEIDLARPKQNLNNTMFTFPERVQIDKLLAAGFIDSFRKFNSEGGNYSWWPYMYNARSKNIGWRIDYIFASSDLENKLKDAFILKDVVASDHCPIGIEIDLK